jgi:hypothetical protein
MSFEATPLPSPWGHLIAPAAMYLCGSAMVIAADKRGQFFVNSLIPCFSAVLHPLVSEKPFKRFRGWAV